MIFRKWVSKESIEESYLKSHPTGPVNPKNLQNFAQKGEEELYKLLKPRYNQREYTLSLDSKVLNGKQQDSLIVKDYDKDVMWEFDISQTDNYGKIRSYVKMNNQPLNAATFASNPIFINESNPDDINKKNVLKAFVLALSYNWLSFGYNLLVKNEKNCPKYLTEIAKHGIRPPIDFNVGSKSIPLELPLAGSDKDALKKYKSDSSIYEPFWCSSSRQGSSKQLHSSIVFGVMHYLKHAFEMGVILNKRITCSNDYIFEGMNLLFGSMVEEGKEYLASFNLNTKGRETVTFVFGEEAKSYIMFSINGQDDVDKNSDKYSDKYPDNYGKIVSFGLLNSFNATNYKVQHDDKNQQINIFSSFADCFIKRISTIDFGSDLGKNFLDYSGYNLNTMGSFMKKLRRQGALVPNNLALNDLFRATLPSFAKRKSDAAQHE